MELDSEKIILEIQALPYLYDTKHPDYKNRQKRRDGWAIVTANVVGEAWEEMDKEQKEALGKEVQKKWKSIKDCYIKNKKSQDSKSGDAAKHKKNYIYYKQLSFLQSAFAERQTSGNMINDEGPATDAEIQSVEEEEYTDMTDLEHNIELASTSTASTSQTRIPHVRKQGPLPKKRRVRLDEFETKFLNVLETSLQKSPQKESFANDPDAMLLLSQLPSIKNMSPAAKMEFQVKYLQLVQAYATSDVVVNLNGTEDDDSVMSLFTI